VFLLATWIRGIFVQLCLQVLTSISFAFGAWVTDWVCGWGMPGKSPPDFGQFRPGLSATVSCTYELQLRASEYLFVSARYKLTITPTQHNFVYCLPWAWALIIRPVLRHQTIVMQRSWSQDGYPPEIMWIKMESG